MSIDDLEGFGVGDRNVIRGNADKGALDSQRNARYFLIGTYHV